MSVSGIVVFGLKRAAGTKLTRTRQSGIDGMLLQKDIIIVKENQ